MKSAEHILKDLENKLNNFDNKPSISNIGIVEKNTDGVITVSGLTQAQMGEIVEFEEKEKGVILNLDEDSVSIILLGKSDRIKEGDSVKSTGKLLNINVSEKILGRIVDPLGNPLDDKPKIINGKDMPLEKVAAGVVEREPVNTPLKTGIKAIDAMIPIGRGQRELIIGDRGTGKTAVAIDTIINQKGNVLCIYVAIGQKRSTTAQVIEKLRETKALDYTTVVNASASDPASLLYLAPYAGVAIAEYFMQKGKDVLVIYDDLTKHAWAYRQISLVLRRPAGREAYPGDIFYLHSRLLERAVKMNKDNGGGSITALPIIETQANDLSAYIPTNVISITDGQIFFLTDLFYSGVRPAIDAGNSVSRVGGAAQTPAIKSIAGKMRLELAQYNNLAAFAQFGSELDEATAKQLERGKRTIEILKQPQYQPLSDAFEFLSIWLVTSGSIDDIEFSQISNFENEYHQFMKRKYEKLLNALSKGGKPDEKTLSDLEKTVSEFKKIFKV
ncbi:MAG: F0F1 ATP synthase subunit alpha [Candidatus Levybacteria bacterium RIFCSPLOWO2_01_FULL_36_13]|nr:MAG: F0F1 ATP synthase subunit alpha [Candidatus Levybacteria bacterium RIFCSPHIGHO2_01_FULL_36_15b]OGH35576.1 MAG: F0F1 ATP synthase subunit alpha [Candidatus Levybacteria bacterium RIFCSPLOWO2_01_FULL_36_13]